MALTSLQALCFLPFVLPICLYVCFTDLSRMKIPNPAVLALGAVFVLVGPWVMPLADFGWRLVHLVAVLVLGIALNAGGLMGAGDAKFAAAAAPYVALGDLRLLLALFAANLLAAVATHRLVKHSRLRRIAPAWKSWDMGWKFPMGLSLGGTLILYLLMGLVYGA